MIINRIIQGDSIDKLRELPDNSIDLIFADPPYNLQLENELIRPNENKFEGVEDEWDKFDTMKEYDKFSIAWLRECRRILKDTGSIWVIGTYHNIFRIGNIMQDMDFWILNDIVWIKVNPTPNFKGTRFNNAHETIIWASKSKKSKFTFHYQTMKRFNDNKQMRSDWLIPICQGSERVKIDGVKAHPTQKPEALLNRVILSSSNIGDVVLDPFFGSGTTGAVAKKLKRNWLGIERDQKYISVANERINSIVVDKNIPENVYTTFNRKNATRVKFSQLIDAKMINIGDTIYSRDKSKSAIVKADASVISGNISGSIHSLSAYLLNIKNNNGWDYWYCYYDNKFISINVLREIYRKSILGENTELVIEDYKNIEQVKTLDEYFDTFE